MFACLLAVVFLAFFRLGTLQVWDNHHTSASQRFEEESEAADFFLNDSVSRSVFHSRSVMNCVMIRPRSAVHKHELLLSRQHRRFTQRSTVDDAASDSAAAV